MIVLQPKAVDRMEPSPHPRDDLAIDGKEEQARHV
jgi:hypothetical protein